jgi:hypothetical protein
MTVSIREERPETRWDMTNVDDPVPLAVYNVDDVEIGPPAAVPSGNAP